MTTIKWNVDSDGDWSDTTNNWSPKQFPNSSSDVTINTTDLHTITYSNGTTATVHSLTVGNDNFTVTAGSLTITTTASFANAFEQDGGTIIGTGTLTMNGATTLAGGNQHGTGTTLLNGPTTISGEVAFDGSRVLENKGTLTWADGEIDLGYTSGGNIGNATLKNDAGATFDIQSDNEIYNGKGANTLVNAGTLTKTVTSGTTEIDVALTNTGTVSVQTGTLELDAGGSSAASAITLASGTVLDFYSGTFTLGAGTIAGTGLVQIAGGKLELGAASVTVNSFEYDSGTVDGTSTLTVKGPATFVNGWAYQTGTGTTLLKGATTIEGAVALDAGRILENKGTLIWSDNQIDLGYNPNGTAVGNATIKNDSGATFNIQSDQTIYNEKGTTAFVNAGTLEKTSTTGTTYIQVPLTNTGTVSVQTGTLRLDGGGSSAASAFTLAAGTTLEFYGGTFTLGAGTIAGTGLVQIAGGKLELGAASVTVNSFEYDSGTVDGTGTLTVKGPATFVNGWAYQTGTGTTLLKGATTIEGAVALDAGRILENKGTLAWSDDEIDLGYNPYEGSSVGSATIKNDSGATFNIQSDQRIYNEKGTTAFLNAGTLEKTDTTGTTEIDVALTNTGTVSVHTGTLLLDGGGSSAAGAITAASGTTIAFGGGTFTLGAGTIGGKGLVSVKGGKLELGSGSVNVTSFEQDYGTVDGSGTLTVKGVANFDGPVYQSGTGKTLLQGATTISDNVALDGGRVLENQKTLTWSDGAISLGYNPSSTNIGNATIKNDSGATFNIQSDRTIYKEKGTTSFVNAGTLEKTNSTGTTYIEVPFINTGTVSVHTGTLQFDNAMTGSGSFTVSSGAALILDASATTAANTIYIASGGGSVSLTGGSGSDTFKFAGNLAKSSTLDGGGGTNTVVLNGDYTGSHALVFGATTMVNVQKLTLSAGHSYNLKTNDATVAAGQKLTVDASTLGATDSLTFNGSAETDGKFVIIGGAGIDTLTGGKGADTITGGSGADKITGGGGADSLTGGAGADTFIYKAASDSTSTKYDTITGFDATSDKIDTWFKVTGVNTALTTGALNSGTNFNANLKTAIGSHLTAHHAIEFTPNSGSLAGQHFLIVDVNGTAGYQAGSDLVINLVSPTHMTSLAVGTFT